MSQIIDARIQTDGNLLLCTLDNALLQSSDIRLNCKFVSGMDENKSNAWRWLEPRRFFWKFDDVIQPAWDIELVTGFGWVFADGSPYSGPPTIDAGPYIFNSSGWSA